MLGWPTEGAAQRIIFLEQYAWASCLWSKPDFGCRKWDISTDILQTKCSLCWIVCFVATILWLLLLYPLEFVVGNKECEACTLAAIQLQGNSTCKLHCRASHFTYFWSQLLTDFDVTPLKSKLKFSSTCIWTNLATRGPIMHPQIAKMCPKSTNVSIIGHFKTSYRHHRGIITSYFCRVCHKLWLEGVTLESAKN